jgi:hypothetical protein
MCQAGIHYFGFGCPYRDRALGAFAGYRKGGIHYAGKAGTDFSMKEAGTLERSKSWRYADLHLLGRNRTFGRTNGGPSLDQTSLACEVAFTEWTDEVVFAIHLSRTSRDKDAREVKKRRRRGAGRNAKQKRLAPGNW